MIVHVRFFAALREHFGSRIFLNIPENYDARSLIESLVQENPAWSALLRRSRLAYESRILEADELLDDREIISVLPPPSGG